MRTIIIYVRNKDTLSYFSQVFNIPLRLIEKSNLLIQIDVLSIDQEIHIPGYRTDVYTIKKGDSLWSIAMNNNLTAEAIDLANLNTNPSNLKIGDKLLIPKRVNQMLITDVDEYTYEKMLEDLALIQSVYPFILQQTIGKSVMNKDIIELQIGAGDKEVHLNGAFHANEWIVTPIIIKFLNKYALSLTNNESIRGLFMLPLFNNTVLSIVPMVNPDGVNLVLKGANAAGDRKETVLKINNYNEDFSDWKANINGVDLNNQYPALWEIEAERKPKVPKPRDYPGPFPLSEPEAIVMEKLARERSFLRVTAFHTQGEEIYWGFEGFEPAISEVIVSEYARVSGYTPIQYLDSYAGYKDWFIQTFKKPGFTIELGRGINPIPITQFPEMYERSLGIMLANLYV